MKNIKLGDTITVKNTHSIFTGKVTSTETHKGRIVYDYKVKGETHERFAYAEQVTRINGVEAGI